MKGSMKTTRGHASVWDDMVLPFQLESSSLRGRFVRLGRALDAMMRQHAYPHPVSRLLAELVALSAAMGTAMKFDGVFTVQTKTDGPLRMMVADVRSDGALRACAQFDAAAILARGTPDLSCGLLGRGSLVMTMDHRLGDERYQGIVPIDSDDLCHAFQLYFRQSEQIPTGLLAAALRAQDADDGEAGWRAGCLMIQRMPREGGTATLSPPSDTAVEDDWLRAMTLMRTATGEELTDPALPAPELLFRLFHEEGVRVYDALPLRHACRCSQERIEDLLASLPAQEVKDMTDAITGANAMTCQFCGKTYTVRKS